MVMKLVYSYIVDGAIKWNLLEGNEQYLPVGKYTFSNTRKSRNVSRRYTSIYLSRDHYKDSYCSTIHDSMAGNNLNIQKQSTDLKKINQECINVRQSFK